MKSNKQDKPSTMKTVRRLMGYVATTYRMQFALVCVTILISALCGMAGPLFLMVLIDDFITPLLATAVPDFTRLLDAVLVMGAIYYNNYCCYFYLKLIRCN